MAIYNFTLTTGARNKQPAVSQKTFVKDHPGGYNFDSQNPQHKPVIEALLLDSSFSHTIQYTDEEKAEIAKVKAEEAAAEAKAAANAAKAKDK